MLVKSPDTLPSYILYLNTSEPAVFNAESNFLCGFYYVVPIFLPNRFPYCF